MKIRGLFLSAATATLAAIALAGCGGTNYYAGRTLPPSGIANRVLIAVQNPSASVSGALTFVDAYYDIRTSYDGKTASYSISGYSGSLPLTIQNYPNEQFGAVYNSGSGALTLVNYAKEAVASSVTALSGKFASIFITSNQKYVFAANQTSGLLSILDNGAAVNLNLPGVYRLSVNVGGTVALAFVKDSNYVYYPVKLTGAESTAYSAGGWTDSAIVDCQPYNYPTWCLMRAQSSGSPLAFDRPTKAVFSSDGGSAYVLNCGPECGGSTASVVTIPVAPMLFAAGARSGSLSKLNTLAIPGGATNALVSGSTMYVAGQCKANAASGSASPICNASGSLWTGMLTPVNLSTMTASSPVSISDGAAGGQSRMLLADDNTLWIATTQCANGARASYRTCLTMYNTSTGATTFPAGNGDATGIAAIPASATQDGKGKVYAAIGGQVYIYQTANGAQKSNENVTVTGTAIDVAYMDAYSDANNTVY